MQRNFHLGFSYMKLERKIVVLEDKVNALMLHYGASGVHFLDVSWNFHLIQKLIEPTHFHAYVVNIVRFFFEFLRSMMFLLY